VNAEQLFVQFFLPLYPPDTRGEEGHHAIARARATDANPGGNPALVRHLADAARVFVRNAPALFGGDDAAKALGLDGTDASVHRLSAALTRARRDAWAAQGAPGSPENALFNAVVHGAAYVGECIVASRTGRAGHGAVWSVRRPLWESLVRLRSRAGEASLAVFSWWLKSLADEAYEAPGRATLADRYRTYVEVPCAKPEDLPVLAPADRSLPRLKDPRYDTLHKYLRAHLPELRDVGEDFPSPERFAELRLSSVDFFLVGGGRMLLMAGAAADGLHLLWVTTAGFEKSAFLPSDAFPAPVVRVEGDRVLALTSHAGAVRTTEMLWWGP
jgi:hypothetical protein